MAKRIFEMEPGNPEDMLAKGFPCSRFNKCLERVRGQRLPDLKTGATV
jgi:hypothetical protein